MKVLVTGGLGYIGSVLVGTLLRNPENQVLCVDNLNSPHSRESMAALMGLDLFEDISFQNIDVCDEQAMDDAVALYRPDFIVNLAGIVGEPLCKQFPRDAYAVNFEAPVKLAAIARKHGARMVAFSTCSNYGLRPDDDAPAGEDAPLSPVSLYAETKVKMEEHLIPKEHVTVLRLATVFGLSPAMRWDLLLNQFVMEAHANNAITVYGPGAWRPIIYVGDVARIIIDFMQKPEPGVFNVGSDGLNFTKGQLAEMVTKEFGNNCKIEQTGLDDRRSYRVDFGKLRQAQTELFTDPASEIYRMKRLFDNGYRLLIAKI